MTYYDYLNNKLNTGDKKAGKSWTMSSNIYKGQKQKKTQTTQICANKNKNLKKCSVPY